MLAKSGHSKFMKLALDQRLLNNLIEDHSIMTKAQNLKVPEQNSSEA